MPSFLTRALVVAIASLTCSPAAADPTPTPQGRPAAPATTATPADRPALLTEQPFRVPESVLYDEANDLYIVTNVHGNPLDKDNNGYISRIAPDGTVRDIRWIEGGDGKSTLSAPKGMAFHGSELWVTDIDAIRIFDRKSGTQVGAIQVPEATFLNDLAAGPDGTMYATDSGLKLDATGALVGSGTDAIYRFEALNRANPIAKGEWLGRPNGLVVTEKHIYTVTFAANKLIQLDLDGRKEREVELPKGGLDGLVRLPDGSFLVSSWEGRCVFQVPESGKASIILGDLDAPADLGWDPRRYRVLVPLFNKGRVVQKGLPKP